MATVLEDHMAGRTFIVGDAITAADCVTAYLMDWANEAGPARGQAEPAGVSRADVWPSHGAAAHRRGGSGPSGRSVTHRIPRGG